MSSPGSPATVTRPGAVLFFGPSGRRDHDGGGDLVRHPAGADARPEGVGQLRRDRPGFPAGLRVTHVFGVDEVLDRVHWPIERTEEQRRSAPHGLDELLPRHAIPSCPPYFVRVTGQPGPDESGPTVGSPFTHNEVCNQVGGEPTLAQRGRVGTTLHKKVAESLALQLGEGGSRHWRIVSEGEGTLSERAPRRRVPCSRLRNRCETAVPAMPTGGRAHRCVPVALALRSWTATPAQDPKGLPTPEGGSCLGRTRSASPK